MTRQVVGGTSRAVTKQYDFFNATPEGENLFSVRAGIPLCEAFNHLSLLLSASKGVLDDVSDSLAKRDTTESQWAGVHLMEFTYALVQAMHEGLIDHESKAALTVSTEVK